MRICYLINGLNGGGAAFPMIDVIRVMRARGHEVSVLACMRQDGRAISRLVEAEIPYEIIGSGIFDVVLSSVKLLRRLRAIQPDLLWTSLSRAAIMGQLAGRMLNIPVISWQHSAFLNVSNLAILRRTRHLTRRWISDSLAVKHFLQIQLGITADKIDIWPLFEANPNAPQASGWDNSGPFRIGSLGRVHFNKRFDIIVRAAARIRELNPELSSKLEFIIGGDGPELARLKSLAAKLEVDNLKFPGFEKQPTQFLASLHAYMQPSRKEGLCVAAHEAMQAALPIVASPVGEIANSVLNSETGWLCEIGNADAFARAVIALASDPARSAQMGIAGRARVLTRFPPGSLSMAGHQILEEVEREFPPTPRSGQPKVFHASTAGSEAVAKSSAMS